MIALRSTDPNKKDISYYSDQFKDDSPHSVCQRKFHFFPLYFPKDSSDGSITGKPFCRGKYAILQPQTTQSLLGFLNEKTRDARYS